MFKEIKISQFQQLNSGSLGLGDLVPIVRQTGFNAYQNYSIPVSQFIVPSASVAGFAYGVNFSNIVGLPRLISSSNQFTSSDNIILNSLTASSAQIGTVVITTASIGYITVNSLHISQSQNIQEDLFVGGKFQVSESVVFGGNLYVSQSISATSLVVSSSSTFSGSNILGNSGSNVQTLIGNVHVSGNLSIQSGSKISADSASFSVISSLPSASISNLTSSVVLVSNYLSVPTASILNISASNLTAVSESVGFLSVTGNVKIAGQLQATASNALSSSYSTTASYALNANATTSYSISSSQALTASLAASSSYAATASQASMSFSASFASNAATANSASYATYAATASVFITSQSFQVSTSFAAVAGFASSSLSSSFSSTASYATGYVTTAPNTIGKATASYAVSASALDNSYNYAISSASIVSSSLGYTSITNAVVQKLFVTSLTASLHGNADTSTTASYVGTAQFAYTASTLNTPLSSSLVPLAQSSSYSVFSATSAFATQSLNSSTASYVVTPSIRQTFFATNSFVPGQILSINASGPYLASAASTATSNILGVIELSDTSVSASIVVSSGSFYTVNFGGLSRLPSVNLISGSVYYLSDSTPGGYSLTQSSNPSSVVQSVFTAITSNQIVFNKVAPITTNTTSSFAVSASRAISSLTATTSATASYVASASFASNALTSNTAQNAISSSYATFAATASLFLTQSLTSFTSSFASNALNVTNDSTLDSISKRAYYGLGTQSIDWSLGNLIDTGSVISLDWNNRILWGAWRMSATSSNSNSLTTLGQVNALFSSATIQSSSYAQTASVLLGAVQSSSYSVYSVSSSLSSTASTVVNSVFNTTTQQAYDSVGYGSIDWSNRLLKSNFSSSAVLDWNNSILLGAAWRMQFTGSTSDSLVTLGQLNNLTSNLTVNNAITAQTASSVTHLVGNSSTPIINILGGAGTSPVYSITGSDLIGKISITAGTSTPTGTNVAFIQFSNPFPTGSFVFASLSDHNVASVQSDVYASQETTTGFYLVVGPTALTTGQTYEWVYIVGAPR